MKIVRVTPQGIAEMPKTTEGILDSLRRGPYRGNVEEIARMADRDHLPDTTQVIVSMSRREFSDPRFRRLLDALGLHFPNHVCLAETMSFDLGNNEIRKDPAGSVFFDGCKTSPLAQACFHPSEAPRTEGPLRLNVEQTPYGVILRATDEAARNRKALFLAYVLYTFFAIRGLRATARKMAFVEAISSLIDKRHAAWIASQAARVGERLTANPEA